MTMPSVDLVFRCFSQARWQALAVNRGIYMQDGTDYIVQPGFAVDEIGNLVLTPAVVDASGNTTTEAVLDTWWTVNVRLFNKQADDDADTLYPGETDTGLKFTKSKLARFVRAQATQKTLNGIRVYEFGATTNRVQLIDPRDLVGNALYQRVWAGGMTF